MALAQGHIERAAGRPIVKRAYGLLFASLVERTDRERSRRLAELAAKHFAVMGNVLLGEIASGGKSAAQEAAPAPSALTARQMEIAQLVAEGGTNRSIAAALHISEHTVEHHLSGIFERLGLRSRTQLAHMLGLNEAR